MRTPASSRQRPSPRRRTWRRPQPPPAGTSIHQHTTPAPRLRPGLQFSRTHFRLIHLMRTAARSSLAPWYYGGKVALNRKDVASMPSSPNRHRLEIPTALYARLEEEAQRRQMTAASLATVLLA